MQGLWVGNKVSKIEYMSYNSFIKNGFQYVLYTYEDVSGLPEGVIVKDANKIVDEKSIVRDSSNSLGGFSDLFRWNLMYKRGGIYVDSDVICLKRFNTENNVVAGEFTGDVNAPAASTQYLKFEKEHPLIKVAVDESRKKDLSKIHWAEVGPRLIQELTPQQSILDYNNFNPNHYWNWDYVMKKEKTDFLLDLTSKENVYGIHLWNEMWRRAGVDKHKPFEDGSFMHLLEEKYLH